MTTDVEPGQTASPRWFSRGLAGIGTSSFLADIGHEMPTALLPSLLTATLHAPASALGLIEASRMRQPGWPGSRAGRWQMIRAEGAGSESADIRLRRCCQRRSALSRRPGRPGSCGPGRGPHAGCGSRRPMPCWPISTRPARMAGLTASSGPWTTSGPSAGRCWPSAWSPRLGPGRHRPVGHSRPARCPGDHLRHPPCDSSSAAS
jgi:hypothetical protein